MLIEKLVIISIAIIAHLSLASYSFDYKHEEKIKWWVLFSLFIYSLLLVLVILNDAGIQI